MAPPKRLTYLRQQGHLQDTAEQSSVMQVSPRSLGGQNSAIDLALSQSRNSGKWLPSTGAAGGVSTDRGTAIRLMLRQQTLELA